MGVRRDDLDSRRLYSTLVLWVSIEKVERRLQILLQVLEGFVARGCRAIEFAATQAQSVRAQTACLRTLRACAHCVPAHTACLRTLRACGLFFHYVAQVLLIQRDEKRILTNLSAFKNGLGDSRVEILHSAFETVPGSG